MPRLRSAVRGDQADVPARPPEAERAGLPEMWQDRPPRGGAVGRIPGAKRRLAFCRAAGAGADAPRFASAGASASGFRERAVHLALAASRGGYGHESWEGLP
jgi:hypothetical protein